MLRRVFGTLLLLSSRGLLLKEGLTSKELALVLPPRTLAHRWAKGQPLSPVESDRALRMARLVALAESVFADREKALRWLRKP